MGASSSGLLDEAKISHIKGLVDSTFRSFSEYYHQQYPVAYYGHLHQEVEPKKEGRGQLLKHRPPYGPEEVLYQKSVKLLCWDEQGKKFRERYVVLRRDYKVEIHDSMEAFNRGGAAKLTLQPAGGHVFTTEEESRAHLEKTCSGILNGVKEESSAAVSSPDAFTVYLHLPYTGHTCFLFQQESDRDLFLSALKTCIRHRSLDSWSSSSYENQTYVRALRLYRQDKRQYGSWEILLGTEEQVLTSQVMEEVLPWLQSQLQSRVKGKKTERIRAWLATVQATYTLVLEQLTAALETLREECRQSASANQGLIRSNLDQIMSSHCFLEQKVRASVCEEAENMCSESIAPYLSSILEVLTETVSAGILGMQDTLRTHMDLALLHTNGGTEDTMKALSSLHSVSLDQCYSQVENLSEKVEGLKQRFGLGSPLKLVQSAQLEMEQLLESAVYTLEQFIKSSSRLQPSQVPVKMERAKERVLKQLDYDCRVIQRRLYEEALLEISLPTLTSKMDSKWKTELQQFEQYIFSDYSSFILVHNVYDDILRSILTKEIETVVQDVANTKTNNLLLDTSDLAISQYSLLGQTPPQSAPGSPAIHSWVSSKAEPDHGQEATRAVVECESQAADGCPRSKREINAGLTSDPSTSQSSDQGSVVLSPVIIVTQQFDESDDKEAPGVKETSEQDLVGPEEPSPSAETTADNLDAAVIYEVYLPDPPADTKPTTTDSSEPFPLVAPQPTSVKTDCSQSEQPETSELPASTQISEEASSIQPLATDSPVNISLGSLSEAIGCSTPEPPVMVTVAQQPTDRAVYLKGQIKDNWEVERLKEEKHSDGAEREGKETIKEETVKAEEGEEERDEEETEAHVGGEAAEDCSSSGLPAEGFTALKTERPQDKGAGSETRTEAREGEEAVRGEESKEKMQEEVLQSSQPTESQPDNVAELPLDSVACIRELVTEIIEVETVISPCSNNSNTP
ncbi:protein Niban 1-like isoform 2-T2 [Pholidichthys leucotaenia]